MIVSKNWHISSKRTEVENEKRGKVRKKRKESNVTPSDCLRVLENIKLKNKKFKEKGKGKARK